MGGRVLVVDDNVDFLNLVEALLAPEGYSVALCSDAAAAYSQAIELRPSAVLLDLVMPGLAGWEVAAKLRSDHRTAGIPIVVCTASTLELTRHAAELAGPGISIIPKPFDLDDLLALVERATHESRCLPSLAC